MARNTPEEVSKEFPIGTVIRMDQTQLDRFKSEPAAKLKDRIGVVHHQFRDSCSLLLNFPAIGRRQEFRTQATPDKLLQKVEDPTEIAAWRAEVAATAARIEKNRLAKLAKKAKACAPA
jgi:hypothetical protein